MKLKFIKNINEAEQANSKHGKSILAYENVEQVIKPQVESAEYRYASQKEHGFYILPKYNYISRLVISQDQNNEDNIAISIFDSKAKNIESAGIKYDNYSVEKSALCVKEGDSIKPGKVTENIVKTILNIIPNKTTFELKEDYINEDGFLTNLKNKIKNAKDKKAAEKEKETVNETFITELEKVIHDAFFNSGAIDMDKNYSSKTKNDTCEIEIKSKYLLGVQWQINDDVIKLWKLLLPSGDKIDFNYSLVKGLGILGNNLNIKFDLSKLNKDTLKITGSDDEEIKDTRDYSSRLKRSLPSDVLDILTSSSAEVSESFNLSEGIILNEADSVGEKYHNAWNKTKDVEVRKNIIRWFLLTEHKLDEKESTEQLVLNLFKLIEDGGGFKKNLGLTILIQYYKIHKAFPKAVFKFATDVNADTQEFRELVKNEVSKINGNSKNDCLEDKLAIYYIPAFYLFSDYRTEQQSLLKAWQNENAKSSKINNTIKSERNKKLVDSYLELIGVEKDKLKEEDGKTIKDVLFFDGDKFRDIKYIKVLLKLLGGQETVLSREELEEKGKDVSKSDIGNYLKANFNDLSDDNKTALVKLLAEIFKDENKTKAFEFTLK